MAQEASVAPEERVNIVYKPATGDAKEEVGLPLKLPVLGDCDIFIELASRLARQYGIGYVSFFWSKHFFAYLPRGAQTGRLQPGQVLRQSNRPAYQGMMRGDATASGRAFERAARER